MYFDNTTLKTSLNFAMTLYLNRVFEYNPETNKFGYIVPDESSLGQLEVAMKLMDSQKN